MRYIIVCFCILWGNPALAEKTILILGDSLSAGYGIEIKESWPTLLQNKLDKNNHKFKVHNASISGQTSAEGLRQINQLLQLTKPSLVVLELGANDGLRGLSIAQMKNNLQTMISKSLQANAKVLLVGIRVPNNYGKRFGQMFSTAFDQLAKDNNIAYVPFLLAPLEQVINSENRAEYIQRDGLHPTAKAQPLLMEHVWGELVNMIK
ncbi:arylesterase [Oceaniserpentilla sp. 4NH20-0058]|uniref:arylesterase n=1 Tax=Oceaniserpentilla sp. 4NH20-0058 TaxID=3127660 RepID=UPI0031083E4A